MAIRAFASVLLAMGCLISGPRRPRAVDACDSKLPDDLKLVVQERFKGYNLPRVADNLQGDVEYSREHGGNGCLGVASADFNGDGQLDYGLLLTAMKGEPTLLVAALRASDGWMLEHLRTWKSERNRLYVGVAAPGKYHRAESFNYPPSELGEQESVESASSGLVTGRTEASGIYYFWSLRGWSHVWVID